MPREPPVTSATAPSGRTSPGAAAPAAVGVSGSPGQASRPHSTSVAPHVKPGAERGEQHARPVREAALVAGLASASGIDAADVLPSSPIAFDDALGRQLERSDSACRMRAFAWWKTKRSTSASVAPARAHASPRRLTHPRDRVAEDLGAVHRDEAGVARSDDQVRARAVGAEHDGPDRRSPAALEHDRARAVAEERRGAAVGRVGVARQDLRADDEHAPRAAGLDQRAAERERRDEARAGGVDVDRAGTGRRRSPLRPTARCRA